MPPARMISDGGAGFYPGCFCPPQSHGLATNTKQLLTKAGLAQDALDEACVPPTKPADAGEFIDKASERKF